MQKTEHYKNCILDARAYELRDTPGWGAQVMIARNVGPSTIDTPFTLKEYFTTPELAIEAALTFGRSKVDAGFEPVIVGQSLSKSQK